MFRVTDTGFGMDAATLSRAFEPYFTTKAPGRGTGLGLATVFAFVSQSGGRVDATSEVGRGSTFTISLPQAADAEAPGDVPAAGTATVLVVEPEAGVRELISEILELHGYHILTACDLDEALGISLRHAGPIALAVADLLLPGVAGDGLAMRLGARRSDMKILYLSGDLQSTIEEYRGLAVGARFPAQAVHGGRADPEGRRHSPRRAGPRIGGYWLRRRRRNPRNPWGRKITISAKMMPTGIR